MPSSVELICVDPARVHEIWPLAEPLLRGAIARTGLSAFCEIEREILCGDALLWLWATHPMLPAALEVMAAWRARFVTSGVWVKRTARGKLGFGAGYRLRSQISNCRNRSGPTRPATSRRSRSSRDRSRS